MTTADLVVAAQRRFPSLLLTSVAGNAVSVYSLTRSTFLVYIYVEGRFYRVGKDRRFNTESQAFNYMEKL